MTQAEDQGYADFVGEWERVSPDKWHLDYRPKGLVITLHGSIWKDRDKYFGKARVGSFCWTPLATGSSLEDIQRVLWQSIQIELDPR